MPLLKGYFTSDGYIGINRNIRFLKAVDLNNSWVDTLYVDPDNGSDSYDGKATNTPYLNLAKALAAASHEDVIYIRPKSPSQTDYVGDPTPITPATAVNWIVSVADYGLSLIGAGIGENGAHMVRLQGHASVTAYPTLDVRAPYVNVENLGFRAGGSTSGIVRASYTDSTTYANATYHSFGATFKGCHIRNAGTSGGLVIDSAWYTKAINCTFSSCNIGILIGATNSVPAEIVIDGCNWISAAGDTTACIKTTGAVTRIAIRNFSMNHAVPSGGSPNRYISIAAASTGLVSDGSTGAVDPTVADNMTLNSILYSNIWGDGVGPFVDA